MSEIKQLRKNNFIDYTNEFNTFARCYKCKKATPGGINDYLDKRNSKPTKCCKNCREYLLTNTRKTLAKYPNKKYSVKKNKLTKIEIIECLHSIIKTYMESPDMVPFLFNEDENLNYDVNFKLLLKEYPEFNKLLTGE